ncbi:hypothetical protein [Allomesorhizobium camelthorni]|uniref:Uncharacterized protein n=1 Tax=Allomesorhizobium camelthorni TaxID=475069 RepID=A0A6G4W8J6_9HYPH|nr:hypothetical protein [Mesorhizobium camelthorni]NGO50480.1 hypothetical protein [Mesorhizobium camelthorni]
MNSLDRLVDFHRERAAEPERETAFRPSDRQDGPPLDHVPASYRQPEGAIYGTVEKILIGSIILLGVFAFAAGYSWGAI